MRHVGLGGGRPINRRFVQRSSSCTGLRALPRGDQSIRPPLRRLYTSQVQSIQPSLRRLYTSQVQSIQPSLRRLYTSQVQSIRPSLRRSTHQVKSSQVVHKSSPINPAVPAALHSSSQVKFKSSQVKSSRLSPAAPAALNSCKEARELSAPMDGVCFTFGPPRLSIPICMYVCMTFET